MRPNTMRQDKRRWLDRYASTVEYALLGHTDDDRFRDLPSPSDAIARGLVDFLDRQNGYGVPFQRIRSAFDATKQKHLFDGWLRNAKQNAYYTDRSIIQAVWEQFITPCYLSDDRHLNVIEGGCGDGRWIASSQPPLDNISYLGFDIAPVAISFAKRTQSNDDWRFIYADFPGIPLANECYDLLIGNVPFVTAGRGSQGHTSFFTHAAPAIVPGGTMIAFTSTSFLDSADNRARIDLQRDFDLLLAVRMVSFCENGNAPGNLVILRKRFAGEPPRWDGWVNRSIADASWLDEHCTPDWKEKWADELPMLNRYFIDNPSHIIGGATPCNTRSPNGNWSRRVSAREVTNRAEAISQLSGLLLGTRCSVPQNTTTKIMPDATQDQNLTTTLDYTKATHAMMLELQQKIEEQADIAEILANLQRECDRGNQLQSELDECRRELSAVSNAYHAETNESLSALLQRHGDTPVAATEGDRDNDTAEHIERLQSSLNAVTRERDKLLDALERVYGVKAGELFAKLESLSDGDIDEDDDEEL